MKIPSDITAHLAANFPPGRRHSPAPQRIRRHRALFISDIHLGTRGCKAELLLDFLLHNDCETLYLVGDIVDGWALKRSWYWDDTHTDVVHAILAKVKEGTQVIYIPGNHDECLRDYTGFVVAGIELRHEAVHRTADGQQLLVVHGDRYDGILTYARWLACLGDWAYGFALTASEKVNRLRHQLGLPYWSFAAFLKQNVKQAASFIARFEETVTHEARMRGLDGVVCGHIHHAALRVIDGVSYANDGDWVESCTALAEDRRGRLQVVSWRATEARAPAASLPWDTAAEAALNAA
jgi:UDP-2,3-diacylglucosamine pyrophosphatase LpxH